MSLRSRNQIFRIMQAIQSGKRRHSDESLDDICYKFALILIKNSRAHELTPRQMFCLSLTLHHNSSGSEFDMAHRLAMDSKNAGYPKSEWLERASLDRMLMSKGLPQVYGTQYKYDAATDQFLLWPIVSEIDEPGKRSRNVRSDPSMPEILPGTAFAH